MMAQREKQLGVRVANLAYQIFMDWNRAVIKWRKIILQIMKLPETRNLYYPLLIRGQLAR